MKHLSLQPHNQQLLDFIRAHQPIGAAALLARFDGAGECIKAFSKRIYYLKQQGWLLNDGKSTRALWSVNPKQRPVALPKPRQEHAAKAAPAPAWIGAIVPPRRVDIMNAPPYTPEPRVYRAGAMDYACHPSHVCGEVRPFKGGM